MNAPAEDLEFLKRSAEVIAWIESLDRSINTKKVYYIAVVSTLKGRPDYAVVFSDYKAKQDAYNRAVSERYETQELSERERDNFLSWPEVLEVREKVRQAAHDLMTFQDYIMLCLYTYISPVRLDFANMAIVEDGNPPGLGNYLLVKSDSMTFVLREYKTSKKYGTQQISVPKQFADILRNWLLLNPSGWLLNSSGEPMDEAQLSQRIIGVFKKFASKSVGVSMLRHSFVSWVRRDEPTFLEQQALASAMCHSVGMSVLYRKLA